MNNLRRTKPREFWKLFKHKNNVSGGNVKLQDFYEHFKTLASDVNEIIHVDVDDFLRDFDGTPQNTPTVPELDVPITCAEILKSIKKFKSDKAHGPDTLLNEYFIESAGLICGQLEVLFN